MRLRFPQPDKLPLKCLELRIGSRISCCASRTFACRVALNDRTHNNSPHPLIVTMTSLSGLSPRSKRMGMAQMYIKLLHELLRATLLALSLYNIYNYSSEAP